MTTPKSIRRTYASFCPLLKEIQNQRHFTTVKHLSVGDLRDLLLPSRPTTIARAKSRVAVTVSRSLVLSTPSFVASPGATTAASALRSTSETRRPGIDDEGLRRGLESLRQIYRLVPPDDGEIRAVSRGC